jgi:DUF438 domain-containing protein
MGNYVSKLNLVDSLIAELVKRDITRCGFLKDKDIRESVALNKMKLSHNQMNLLFHVLPFDKSDGTYSYLLMIELLFG